MNKDKSAKLNKKKKLSRKTTWLLAEGYQENAEEDLAIAKDFEAAENELDKNCDK
ncbi:MAG: hypothetical protein ABSD42_00500 [Candidatus Bathyarchaeia archaeon]|jgi:hypothetical protein